MGHTTAGRTSRVLAAMGALALIAVALPAFPAAGDDEVPGQAPSAQVEARTSNSLSAAAEEGMKVIVLERGRISQSTDGAGSLDQVSTLQLMKPPETSLRRAVMFAASTGFQGPMAGAIELDGQPVAFANSTASNIGSVNYWHDVTEQVRAKVDGAPAGEITFEVFEEQPQSVDGVILTLIYDDPGEATDRSVALLFGATRTAGDTFTLRMAEPIDPALPDTVLELSLGISFGYQGPGGENQFSVVDVNGQRLTTSAGGEDDGESANGALITVGGTGDTVANPDPFAPVTGPRTDDELYDLRPFVSSGDTTIRVDTSNPSNDDNIFFASFTTNPPVTGIGTPSDPDPGPEPLRWLALGDSYSAGVGGRAQPDDATCRTITGASYSAQAAQLARAAGRDVDFRMRACLGAVTRDIWARGQEGTSQTRQIEYVRDFEPDVVTLTVGGNDLGFPGIVTRCQASVVPVLACAVNPDQLDLVDRMPPSERTGWDGLYDRLVLTYSAIRNVQGPDGHLYVLTYPTVFERPALWGYPANLPPNKCQQFRRDDAFHANQLSTRLGDTIFLAAEHVDNQLGNVHFVDWREDVIEERARRGGFLGLGRDDVRVAYNSKGLCSRSSFEEWDLNPLILPIAGEDYRDSFHPTRVGYAKAAERLWNVVDRTQ